MIEESVAEGSTAYYTDQHGGYIGLKRKGYKHVSVNHAVGEAKPIQTA